MAIGSPRYNDRYVEQITTTVRGLMARDKEYGTNSLQQFAEKHKTDPIVMSVISTQRSLAASFAPREAQQPGTPPPVNEQLVASLSSGQAPMQGGAGSTGPAALPENQGIARLPMQTEFAAEGGIVGYADGGVARFNGDTESEVKEDKKSLLDQGRELVSGMYDPTRPIRSRLPYYIQPIYSQLFPEPERPPEGPPVSQRTMDARDALAGRPVPAAAPTPAPARPAPRPASGIAQLAAPRTPAVDPRKQAMEDARYFFDQIKPRDTETGAKKLEEIEAKSVAAREKARKEYLAALPKDQIGAEAEARYKKEAEAEPERRKEALYMALVEAGLGMMASRSPYALQGIGEGAMRGVGSYKNAMKELDSLARSRNEALDSISKARRAEQMGNAKEAYEYAQTADSNANKFAKEMFNFVQGRKDLDQQDKMNIMKSIYADFNADARLATELRSRERVAGMQLAARTDSIDAQILAAHKAGNAGEVQKLIALKQATNMRGALTQDQINDNIAQFFKDYPRALRTAESNPDYAKAVVEAAKRGERPPFPPAAGSAVRVAPTSPITER